VISEYTYAAVADRVLVEAMGPVQVKGKTKQVEIYRITGLADGSLKLPPMG
jgi:class 3 adenylate cyclase